MTILRSPHTYAPLLSLLGQIFFSIYLPKKYGRSGKVFTSSWNAHILKIGICLDFFYPTFMSCRAQKNSMPYFDIFFGTTIFCALLSARKQGCPYKFWCWGDRSPHRGETQGGVLPCDLGTITGELTFYNELYLG